MTLHGLEFLAKSREFRGIFEVTSREVGKSWQRLFFFFGGGGGLKSLVKYAMSSVNA